MMRFLQRQRKSIRSGEFFKCHLCLLLIAAMLVAAALPNGVRESGPLDSVKRMGQTGGQEFCPDRKQTGTMGTMGGGTYTEEDNTIIPL